MRHTRLLTIIAAAAVFFTDFTAAGADPSASMGITAPKVRVEAPAFTLTDLNWRAVSLDDFRGRIVIVHFWATWCVPCRDEMTALEALWREFRNSGVVVVGVSIDKGEPSGVRRFCEEKGISFPVLLDREGIVREKYEITSLPSTYIIGKDGKITGRAIGFRDWGSRAALEMIRSLLN